MTKMLIQISFISYPRYIEGVEVAIMFKAVEKAVTRVSMRSRNLDVSEIAITFGGGGHRARQAVLSKPLYLKRSSSF